MPLSEIPNLLALPQNLVRGVQECHAGTSRSRCESSRGRVLTVNRIELVLAYLLFSSALISSPPRPLTLRASPVVSISEHPLITEQKVQRGAHHDCSNIRKQHGGSQD